jgi:hypothetical protein
MRTTFSDRGQLEPDGQAVANTSAAFNFNSANCPKIKLSSPMIGAVIADPVIFPRGADTSIEAVMTEQVGMLQEVSVAKTRAVR